MNRKLKRFTAKGEHAKFLQTLNDNFEEIEKHFPGTTPGTLISRTSRGTFQKPTVKAKAGPSAEEPTTVTQYVIREIHFNHLVCQKHNGTVGVEEDDIKIAMPVHLRRETYDGEFEDIVVTSTVRYSYTHIASQVRRATTNARNWTQRIYPIYKIGDKIFAAEMPEGIFIPVENGSIISDLTLIDINVQCRAWATVFGICDGGTSREMLILGTPPS